MVRKKNWRWDSWKLFFVSTYAESENEAQSEAAILRELAQFVREVTVDVEEIEAAIKEISGNIAELLKTTPPAKV